MSRKNSVKVTNINIEDLTPVIEDTSLMHLIPKNLFSKRISFHIENVSNAVANGIRRTVMNELLIKAMWFELDDFHTTDSFILNTMIQTRLALIPIDQKTPLQTIFDLLVINDGTEEIDVFADKIHVRSGHLHRKDLPFNETNPICTLKQGKELKISKIILKEDYGYNFAGHSVAQNAVSLSLDQKPLNQYLPKDHPDRGISSSISDPRKWKIQFTTTGAMEPNDIVAAACENIIKRIQNFQNLIPNILSNGDTYVLIVDGESDTIGNLLMKTCVELYPNIKACTYNPDSIKRSFTLKIRCDEDVNSVLLSCSKYIIDIYSSIKKAFM
jgi:DNA-directed RNA polymerase subunit L